MRRDIYLQNDSGGLSIVAADAVDDIIDDAREDDARFVESRKALLLELYGDDSMPVRIVAGEPLQADEDAQWLARASWQIDTTDGRLLVMGGFDPDVLSSWKDVGDEDGAGGIAAFTVAPGRWNVDVYAHVGSMNGRAILSEAHERPGAAFRRHHPGRAFPLWLARMLQFSSEDDPGHEHAWKDVRASIGSGELAVDTDGGDAIGFLIHVMPASSAPETAPADAPHDGWFGRSDNARLPEPFPLGVRSEVPDPELRSLHDELLGITRAEPPRTPADRVVEIIEVWQGEPLRKLDGGTVSVAVDELFLMHWLAALTADSPPRFELWVEPVGAWTPPAATPDIAVARKAGNMTALGPVANAGGWHMWWTARAVARLLSGLPEGSTLTLAMAPRAESDEEASAVGRALYEGKVRGGAWEISEASPKVPRDVLADAVDFVRGVAIDGRVRVRPGAERAAFDAIAAEYEDMTGPVEWEGDAVRLVEHDERMLLMLAAPVFRARFGGTWAVDVEE